MYLHFSLVYFEFTSRSTAFEFFSRGIFGLFVLKFFIFCNIKQISLRRGFNQKNKLWRSLLLNRLFPKLIEKSNGLKQSHFLKFWLILKLFDFSQKLPRKMEIKILTEKKISYANLVCASGYALGFEKMDLENAQCSVLWKVILCFSKTNLLFPRLVGH